jgi:hypothetical protein
VGLDISQLPRAASCVARLRHGPTQGSKSNPDRKRLPFKQSEIERGIRAVEAMGLQVHSVELDPHTGKIYIGTSPNSADVDLDEVQWDKRVKKNAKD